MKKKSKFLSGFMILTTLCMFMTPISASNLLNSSSDMSINIKAPEDQSQLPTKPDTGENNESNHEDDATGNLPATGQSSVMISISVVLLLLGTSVLVLNNKGDHYENS